MAPVQWLIRTFFAKIVFNLLEIERDVRNTCP